MILIADNGVEAVGFKVGYERDSDGSFYSWMGGVLPAWRRKGIAALLADEMDIWAIGKGYTHLRFKTRNSHKGMLIFGLLRGFDIIDIDTHSASKDHRILLEKKL